ncbi:MAG: hypothetical protein M1381_11320 [Deltaproteobacteria bacterium]|nr:hypothetical protein [Deltaproteobacteria bacterium]
MGKIIGQKEYGKFKSGQPLSYKEAILAQCYVCNGQEDSAADCQAGNSCPLYQFQPYNPNRKKLAKSAPTNLSEKEKAEWGQRMKAVRQQKKESIT